MIFLENKLKVIAEVMQMTKCDMIAFFGDDVQLPMSSKAHNENGLYLSGQFRFVEVDKVKGLVIFGGNYPLINKGYSIDDHYNVCKAILDAKTLSSVNGILGYEGKKVFIDNKIDESLVELREEIIPSSFKTLSKVNN